MDDYVMDHEDIEFEDRVSFDWDEGYDNDAFQAQYDDDPDRPRWRAARERCCWPRLTGCATTCTRRTDGCSGRRARWTGCTPPPRTAPTTTPTPAPRSTGYAISFIWPTSQRAAAAPKRHALAASSPRCGSRVMRRWMRRRTAHERPCLCRGVATN